MLFFALWACDGKTITTTGELGRLNYVLESTYKIESSSLNEAKLVTGYPQEISADLTLDGWKIVKEEPFMVHHSSPDEIVTDNEGLWSGEIGVPNFSVQSDSAGSFLIESKFKDELLDQIQLDFVKPDEISVVSWIRAPETETFEEQLGENISVPLGAQAAFIPIPKYQGERIIGDVDVEITVDPPSAATVGYNIETVSEDGVTANSSPASIYFVESGVVSIGATDVINNVTTWQQFTVGN